MTETRIVPRPAPGPDLALTKTASPVTVHPGWQVTYLLVVHNRGPGEATGVTVEDPAPSGVFFRQAHPSQGHCTINRELRCALGTIPAGGQALVQVTATIAADASGPIVNHASVCGNQGDPNESNDTAASTVHVALHLAGPGAQPVSDLVVTKHVDPRAARQGQRLRHAITVTNQGPDPATGVRLTDTPQTRILQIHTGQGHCQPGPPLTCTLGTLHPGRARNDHDHRRGDRRRRADQHRGGHEPQQGSRPVIAASRPPERQSRLSGDNPGLTPHRRALPADRGDARGRRQAHDHRRAREPHADCRSHECDAR